MSHDKRNNVLRFEVFEPHSALYSSLSYETVNGPAYWETSPPTNRVMCFIKYNFLSPVRIKYLISGILCVLILDYFGFFAHFFEKEFAQDFNYPYDGDISAFVLKIQQGLKPDMEPINFYNFSYLHSSSEKCKNADQLRLVYLVKSSVENFERREVIRRTWGYEKRFSDVMIRTVFIVGSSDNEEFGDLINKENAKFKDIVQINFEDTYYNNTVKTMSAFKWITEHCPNSRFYFFSDDDMYISTKNVLRFLRNPTNYPDYLQLPPTVFGRENEKTDLTKDAKAIHRHSLKYNLPKNVILFAGFVFISSPHRHKSSKWYVSLREYPYNLWPPYITAGAYVLSNEALFKMHYASFYTKHFKFDDIYLGIVAMKVGIEPFHCDQFHFYKKNYNLYNYKYVVASHGYDDMAELERVWNEQKEAGNA